MVEAGELELIKSGIILKNTKGVLVDWVEAMEAFSEMTKLVEVFDLFEDEKNLSLGKRHTETCL